jgi:ATP-dependent RNA helicase DHX57
MGVAARVAQERLEDVDKNPETVGYAIRGERRAGKDTKLLFCTTGVILRRLGSGDPELEGVSHVIVDEAHERGVDTDLLICLLRDLLERNKTIKVSSLARAGTNANSAGHLDVSHDQRKDLHR